MLTLRMFMKRTQLTMRRKAFERKENQAKKCEETEWIRLKKGNIKGEISKKMKLL